MAEPARASSDQSNQPQPGSSQSKLSRFAKPDKLKHVHGSISLQEAIQFLAYWLEALKIAPLSPTQSTTSVIFRAETDSSPREYDLYPHPQARQAFAESKTRPINALFISDIFQIIDDLRQKIIDNDENAEIAESVRKVSQSNLLENARETIESQDVINPYKLSSQISVIQDQIKDLMTAIGESDTQGEYADIVEDALETELPDKESDEQRVARGLAAVTGQPQPEPGGTEETQQPVQPPETPEQPPAETRPLPSERPYTIVSQNAGFIYNQVVYDLFAVYGLTEIEIQNLNQSPEWIILERQIRQQIMADLYAMNPEEIKALRLGDRSKLAQRISRQLLLQKPTFSTQMEAFIFSSPQIFGQENSQAILTLIQQQPTERQAQLVEQFNEHFDPEKYENDYADVEYEGEEELRNELIKLNNEKFTAQSVSELEKELQDRLLSGGLLQIQNAQSIINSVEYMILGGKGELFVELLTPHHLALMCGLDRIPSDREVELYKAEIKSYLAQYRAILYRATGDSSILVSNDSFAEAVANADDYNQIRALDDALKAKHPDEKPEKIQEHARNLIITRHATTASPSQDQQKAMGQLLSDPDSEAQMTTKERREYIDARVAQAFRAINLHNEFAKQKALSDLYRLQTFEKNLAMYTIFAYQQGLQDQQLAQAQAIDDFNQAVELLNSDQIAVSPAMVDSAGARASIMGAPAGQRQSLTGIAQAQRNENQEAFNDLQRKLALVAAVVPQARIASKIAGFIPPEAQKIIGKAWKDKESIIGAAFVVGGALAGLIIRYFITHPIVLAFTGAGAAVGALLAPVLGPGSILGGGAIGFQVGQFIEALPGKAWGAVKGAGNFVGDTVSNLFGGGGGSVASGGKVLGLSSAALPMAGTALLVGTATYVTLLTIQAALLLPTLDSEGEVSQFVEIEKVAEPGVDFDSPTDITYQVRVRAREGTITLDSAPQDQIIISYNVGEEGRAEPGPETPPDSASYQEFKDTLAGLTGTEIGTDWVVLGTYTIPFGSSGGDYNDATITNTFSMTFTTEEGGDSERALTNQIICFGDCATSSFGCFEFAEPGFSFGAYGYPGSVSKAWLAPEKAKVQDAFARRMGRASQFVDKICSRGTIRLYRLTASSIFGSHAWAPDSGVIAFYDLALGYGPGGSDLEYTFAHELGHILDRRNPSLRSEFFNVRQGRGCYSYPLETRCGYQSEIFADASAMVVAGDRRMPSFKNLVEYNWFISNVYGIPLW